jgi:hypothetical protein
MYKATMASMTNGLSDTSLATGNEQIPIMNFLRPVIAELSDTQLAERKLFTNNVYAILWAFRYAADYLQLGTINNAVASAQRAFRAGF